MKQAVIYTSVTNDYASLKQPKKTQPFAMYCYSNTSSTHPDWEIKPIELINDDPIRTARYYKLHPHKLFPDYEWSIWVDGSLLITQDLSALLREVEHHGPLGVYGQIKRDCLYQAAANCIDKQRDDPQVINQQINKYRQQGYPAHNGLVASGVLVRRHHQPDVVELMEAWWQELLDHSHRDQLSLDYVCWQQGFNYYRIPRKIGDGRFFHRKPHQMS